MKTQLTITKREFGFNRAKKNDLTTNSLPKKLMITGLKRTLILISIFFMGALVSNNLYAQAGASASKETTVKGMVSDDSGPILGANITLKGTKVGTSTDKDGAFIFPKALTPGDILVFSYLGYETQEVKIEENTTFINLVLTTDLIEIMGAVNADTPYKSKR
ncbi:carboxypeptidase-like regulatory domain-containing protein [uncultured Psychroserpens sp.]|uniref:carboxypeptidase-like regulatory domain-containing protein n=1 Tax=uncultured Psychroserpens sp. TaxID=255436 RepID=UPI00263174C5|nr:carboxypeptidase-like regulatory domain-containing protein [uncultured Psychroserpens sp.]